MVLAVSYLSIDVEVLARVGGLIVPILVAVLAKSTASRLLKAMANAVLSAVAGIVALAIAADGQVDVNHAFGAIFDAWTISVASYYGLWKPSAIAAAVARVTSGIGLGASEPSDNTDGVGSEESLRRMRPPRG